MWALYLQSGVLLCMGVISQHPILGLQGPKNLPSQGADASWQAQAWWLGRTAARAQPAAHTSSRSWVQHWQVDQNVLGWPGPSICVSCSCQPQVRPSLWCHLGICSSSTPDTWRPSCSSSQSPCWRVKLPWQSLLKSDEAYEDDCAPSWLRQRRPQHGHLLVQHLRYLRCTRQGHELTGSHLETARTT